MDIMLVRGPGQILLPATEADAESIQSLPLRTHYGCTLTQLRNGRFHRKVFALLRLMYDTLPPASVIHNNQRVQQSFERFRQEQTVLAGHYTADVTGTGQLRLMPVSLSYSKCSERRIQAIYHDLIDHALTLLTGYADAADLDAVVEQLLEFGHGR